jgi:urease accessory protein
MKYGLFSTAIFALLFPAFALAHTATGDSSGLLHGWAHPFSGLDHLCAMIAVGFWATQLGGRAVWLIPLSFVSMMALASLAGMSHIPSPFIESGIVLSLLVMGVLISAAVRLPLLVSSVLVGTFALCHGYAHGAETPADVSGISYAIGFILATSLLHLFGIVSASLCNRFGRGDLVRYVGGLVALSGTYLLVA